MKTFLLLAAVSVLGATLFLKAENQNDPTLLDNLSKADLDSLQGHWDSLGHKEVPTYQPDLTTLKNEANDPAFYMKLAEAEKQYQKQQDTAAIKHHWRHYE